MDEVAHVRRRGHLALVHAGVAVLRIFDLQHPVLRVLVMDGLEALVAGVRVPADRQQMDVAMPHPRHLHQLLHENRARECRWLVSQRFFFCNALLVLLMFLSLFSTNRSDHLLYRIRLLTMNYIYHIILNLAHNRCE